MSTWEAPVPEASQRQGLVGMIRQWWWLPVLLTVFYGLYFSPVLFSGGLLAPGDGIIYYWPFFGLSALDLWNDNLLAGYPILSDIQAQTLYPLRWLAPTFNVLVVSAYVVAGVGAFGLALTLTGSRLGALMSAMVFSGSGFMVAHLGHLSIIHAAAWIPVMLWALASLRNTLHWGPVAAGAVATCFSLLGGHPQITAIGFVLALAFAAHEAAIVAIVQGLRAGARVALRAAAMVALGLMLAAPSLVAVLSSAAASVRGAWSLADFTSYSHTLETLRMAFYPNLYGAYGAGPYGAYSGPWNLTELAIYAGVLPWLLTIAALAGWRVGRSHLFWVAALAVSLVLTLGAQTPLGAALFELPVFGRFRAQARFGLVAVLALSVLAAFGTSALLRGGWSRRRTRLLLGLAGVGTLALAGLGLTTMGGLGGSGSPAIVVPLVLMLASLGTLWLLVLKPGFNAAVMAILLVTIDLATFGWFYEWREGPPAADSALAPQVAAIVRHLAAGNGRVLPVRAQDGGLHPLRPNVNVGFDIQSVVGYGPLLSSRYSQYTGADTTGAFAPVAPDAPLLDVLGVRWVAGLQEGSVEPQLLGAGCGASGNVRLVRGELPENVVITSVRVVSHLGCSQGTVNGSTIAEVQLLDANGTLLATHTLDAGEETAEWAYDRPDVQASISHARPQVAETFNAGEVQGLWFDAEWTPATMAGSSHPRFVQVVAREGAPIIRIKSLSVSGSATSAPVQVSLAPVYDGAVSKLTQSVVVPGLPALQERQAYIGPSWGVCTARTAEPAAIKIALASRTNAAAQGFDPLRTALVETGHTIPRLGCTVPPDVREVGRSHGYRELSVRSQGAGLVVVSDSYNPGWTASINGRPAPVLPVNGLVIGISVPDGQHRIVIRYWPPYFWSCVAVALLALMITFLLGIRAAFPGAHPKFTMLQGKSR